MNKLYTRAIINTLIQINNAIEDKLLVLNNKTNCSTQLREKIVNDLYALTSAYNVFAEMLDEKLTKKIEEYESFSPVISKQIAEEQQKLRQQITQRVLANKSLPSAEEISIIYRLDILFIKANSNPDNSKTH